MFANLLHLIAGRPASAELEHAAFVEDVHAPSMEPRRVRVERLILICWLLIAVKHVAVLWSCQRFAVPFHPLWVNFPTWLLAVLVTAIYYRRTRGGQDSGRRRGFF